MSKNKDFGQDGFLSFWNSMTFDERAELTKTLSSFQILLSSLQARGFLSKDKYGSEITLLKRHPDCTELIKLQKKLPAAGIKIVKAYK